MDNSQKTMEAIVALCKGRGFIYAGSEIYGGLANTWDYGPLGVELKNNVKRAWWKKFVQESDYNVGLDSAILMNPQTWVASGHVVDFNDPLIDCRGCKMRHRADKLIEDYNAQNGIDMVVEALTNEQMERIHPRAQHPLPRLRQKRFYGHSQVQYDVQDVPGRDGGLGQRRCICALKRRRASSSTSRISSAPPAAKCPSASRRSARASATRSRPATSPSAPASLSRWSWSSSASPATDLRLVCTTGSAFCRDWLIGLGMREENLRLRDHEPEELSHYSKATTDFEFLFPFGWGELWGVADRTDFDLSAHQKASGESMEYFDQESGQ